MRWTVTAFALVSAWSWGADLRFQYLDGDRFVYSGENLQSVLLNGKSVQSNTSHSRSRVFVSAGLAAELSVETTFAIESKGARSASQSSETRQTQYSVDTRGNYTVPEGASLPVVRGIPTFPDLDLSDGQTWAAPGSEVVDISAVAEFSRNKTPLPPIVLAFSAAYRYKGSQTRNGKVVDVIEGEYDISQKPRLDVGVYRVYPVLFSGKTRFTVYFDNALGLIESSAEDYVLNLVLSTGDLYEFTGTTTAKLGDCDLKERRAANPTAETRSGSGAALKSAPEPIFFEPDSAVLTSQEQDKIRRLAETLADYSGDLLVAGFTAEAGTKQQQKTLSEARAAAVGDYLVNLGVRSDRIIVLGLGTRKAVRRAIVALLGN